MTWIVMTASAHMPSSCKGKYRKIALVDVIEPDYRPGRIDARDKKITQVIQWGNHNVGKTDRCAYAVALKKAEAHAAELNAGNDPARS